MTARHDDTPHWLDLAHAGTEHFDRVLAALSDEDMDGPSAVPGWTRRHVIAHVGHNAFALARLVDWGRTGVENRMYASTDHRDAEIQEGAQLPPAEIRALAADGEQTLAAGWASLPEERWGERIVTAQGVDRPVSDTPWMRVREVWIHAVDLGTGASFSDIPADIQERLVAEIWGLWDKREQNSGLALEITDGGSSFGERGDDVVVVTGPLVGVTRWAAGRGEEPGAALEAHRGGEPVAVPEPPRWL
ncbi:maleylpyruvate isomerase family mycothiol-dependent enzyme [Mobilicoccus caccae]|uniref:Maleylpyruvate isomerase n=1 Tax=Mobilicoccus caccae TaxID=1859295 RepID=A0ABQ6ITW8_9MICO|nr:maleylpyruvate isomerase family mycothiol-dependent enzyme [Mobilicoccus caccae]GMA40738.1 maleylpyruvate isomerase [Mobilicoccus caccae]